MSEHSFHYVKDPNIGDPNNPNINPNIVNAIPQYQDMHIFAELTATRKGRSVVVIEKGQFNEDALTVNFMGVNQNTGSPNYLNFTSNYYDGSTASGESQDESFGITNIKVIVNSSFIPQVSIQFVDLRGLSFFNDDDSPYRILFDFPPPIFELKIKGYYGQTLSYQLHLVKYDTEFKATNGNFIIDAQFVATTFAPLSDIVFRYIVNAPLINANEIEGLTVSSNPSIPPINTYDLILKLKNLYAEIEEEIKNGEETEESDEIIKELIKIDDKINGLLNFKSILNDNAIMFTYNLNQSEDNTTTTNSSVNKIKNLYEYDEIIKNLGNDLIQPKDINNKLYVGYDTEKEFTGDTFQFYLNNPNEFKLLESLITEDNNLKISKIEDRYLAIDNTAYYLTLYRDKIKLQKRKAELDGIIGNKVNASIRSNLGMVPTIYNIFKIILDDVDDFFWILNDTSQTADKHHNIEYKDIISNAAGYKDVNKKSTGTLYPFPLIVENEVNGCSTRQHKIAPIELSKQLPVEFPELTLVKKFIDTFSKQRSIDSQQMKSAENADGTNVWLPFSPIDSELFSSELTSPYKNVVNYWDLMYVLFNRFYCLSQNVYEDKFNTLSNEYRQILGQSEARNLLVSVADKQLILDSLQSKAKRYTDNIDNFFNDFSSNKTINYSFNNDTIAAVPITNNYPLDKNSNIQSNWEKYDDENSTDEYSYIDKNNSKYYGVGFTQKDIIIQDTSVDENNIFKKFDNENFTQFLSDLMPYSNRDEAFKMTNENLIYFFDDDENDERDKNDDISIETRFLFHDLSLFQEGLLAIPNLAESILNPFYAASQLLSYTDLIYGGNKRFPKSSQNMEKMLSSKTNISELWINLLSKYDIAIGSSISGSTLSDEAKKHFVSVLVLSNFGYTIGPYNISPYSFNKTLFSIPSIVEMPTFLPLYLGALIYAKENEDLGIIEELKTFFAGVGSNITNEGKFIFADYYDVNEYLSQNDKDLFEKMYVDYMNNQYKGFDLLFRTESGILKGYLVELIIGRIEDENIKTEDEIKEYYENELDPGRDDKYYYKILKPLINRDNMGFYYEDVFAFNKDEKNYKAISTFYAQTNHSTKDYMKNFFTHFFLEIKRLVPEMGKVAEDKKIEERKLSGDNDIITQLYYSFKNINDKWLTGPTQTNNGSAGGYPFNKAGKKLIDSFAFVDRGMNPIGDTIINPEILIDMLDNPNITLFSVLSQLLSVNGFEFFPLQNFMSSPNKESWENMFKISSNINVEQNSAFVCMYIGGTSSYPSTLTGSENGFENDGIIDLGTEEDIGDILNGCGQSNNTTNLANQETQNPEFPWRQVRAFKVKFGEQNQSMFSDIKIDSKEYPETNESIQILSRLANDGGDNPTIPKGQNLYNLYENRAYQATISGLGNAMIQPTQYFQLDNVPMFNGAYIILSVEHNITANKMTTSFSGVKILKYPMPRILNPSAALGFSSPSGEYSVGEYTALTGAIDNPKNAKYNSMYEINIQ